MRGSDAETGSLFSYVDLEARVPKQHPLRVIRRLVDTALVDLSPAFAALYAPIGRPSIPPRSGWSGRCCSRRSTRCARSAS